VIAAKRKISVTDAAIEFVKGDAWMGDDLNEFVQQG